MVTASRAPGLVDQYGNPLLSDRISELRARLRQAQMQVIKAKYDAAQTSTGNENHWANTDNFDPHTVANLTVRRYLRSRSRYEIIENNPYLKGVALTLANDFVGGGPKLKVTDKRLSPERQKVIEDRWNKWTKVTKMRQKLWRMRMAKITDGETFMRAYQKRRQKGPIKLNFQVLETDRISSGSTYSATSQTSRTSEIDGVRFDNYDEPLEYHILHRHPGGSTLSAPITTRSNGQWINEKFMIHWFRQDRGWLRGIPELAPSLALCAILRRYTLAIVRHAELAASLSAIIETEGPASSNPWTDGAGNTLSDDPFDVFPIEYGMIMNLPWGYTMKQLDAVPLGVQYDEFVGSILREILRPLLVPYNITAGTSKDSNMASSVVDVDMYKSGQKAERLHCNEEVLDPVLDLWWFEALRLQGYLGDNFLSSDPSFAWEAPEHTWHWDKIGIDHTDPTKVAKALETLRTNHFITDRDIQEQYHNRSVEEWRAEVEEEEEWRQSLPENELPDDTPITGEKDDETVGAGA